jgi:dTDP-4-dehydrorhamnose reductase
MMKILITGANGQLGWELQRVAPKDFEIITLSRLDLDITNNAAVESAFQEFSPELVINAAAYTAVDKAENEKAKAFAVNGDGASNVAKATTDIKARLIHISTDFVFNGLKSQPYLPDDETKPISMYGASKLQGEQGVFAVTEGNALILRTGWVYSSHGSNFVKTMLRLMAERDEISVVADQVGTPTWTNGFAGAIYKFAAKPEVQGIYHWSDAGIASWYDFAVAIQEEAFSLDILNNIIPIKPIRTEDYPSPAKRPPYSVLDKTATWQILGYTAPYWRRSLRQMLIELKEFDYE